MPQPPTVLGGLPESYGSLAAAAVSDVAPSVRFGYRDRAQGDVRRTATLPADRFIGRFLLHVLPHGFMRIRHYGLFANRHRKAKLARCRVLLHQPEPGDRPKETVEAMIKRLTGHDITRCSVCSQGQMKTVTRLRPIRPVWSTGPP